MSKIIKHIQMDRELSNELKKASENEYCSEAAIVRRALVMYFKKEKAESK